MHTAALEKTPNPRENRLIPGADGLARRLNPLQPEGGGSTDEGDREQNTMAGMTRWVEWARSQLTPQEVEEELNGLSASQRSRLQDDHWVWRPGRVLWIDPKGELRRARFTHGAHFRTAKGEFYIDPEGQVNRVRDAEHQGKAPS